MKTPAKAPTSLGTPRVVVPFALLLLLLSLAGGIARAQLVEEIAAPRPAVEVTNPLAEVREVVGEGTAAVSAATGGKIGARRAAIALALRDAVEKALGIYVSGRTVTHNYQMLRDRVLTQADGFATLKEVLDESVGPAGEVRVRVRAEVSLKPLAEQLRALKVTRGLRVHVVALGKPAATAATRAAADTLRARLAAAGFAMAEQRRDADLEVRVWGGYKTVQAIPLETGAGPMTMHSLRGDLSVYVSWPDTSEALTSFNAGASAMHIDRETACREAAGDAAEEIAPQLEGALLILCARLSQPVQLHVQNIGSATRMTKLEEALSTLPGVQSVTRRGYQGKHMTWELDVLSEALPLLSRALEQAPSLKPFKLTVASETRSRITASAR